MNAQWRLTVAAAAATSLTALSLAPTIDTGEWLLPLVLTIAVVAACAGAARQVSLPRWAVTTIAAAALVLAVTVRFANDAAVAWALPGPGAWEQLAALARSGLTTIWQVAPPVPSTRGVELVVTAGVGVVAVVVDAVAVTWRRAAVAGLPLLVLYLVPAAVLPDGVPWPLFVLGALGWIGLLLSDGRERLTRWGRVVTSRGGDDGTRLAGGGTGRRLAAVALAAAVVVPLALPALTEGVFGRGSDGTGTDGGGSGDPGFRRVVTINPLVNLRRDLVRGADTPVLYYRTNDPWPDYLRIATLDQFDGRTWTLEELQAGADQQAADGLPPPPGLGDDVLRGTVTTSFDVVALNSPRLPLPYPATRVDIEGDWRWDADSFDVFTPAPEGTADGVSYVADSLTVAPSIEQLRAASLDDVDPAMKLYTTVPPFTAVELTTLADQVVGDATTPYDQALALQNWFRTKFTYSLEQRGGNDLSDLQSFLKDRSGYCEQFAATMALMARVEGIPSRVQVGFTPGEKISDGRWEVTAHDAHAWPELWFAGVGWVRFEPTPGGGDGGGTPSWAPVPVTPGATPTGQPGQAGGDRLVLRRPSVTSLGPDGRPVPAQAEGARRAGDRTGTAPLPDQGVPLWPFFLGAVLLVGAVLATPVLARWATRRRRWAEADDPVAAAEAAWREVVDAATDVDLRPRPTETPRDLARRLPREASLSAAGRTGLAELAGQLERARYAAPPEASEGALEAGRLRALAGTVRDDLLASLSTRDRRLARWWPASGRAQVAEVVGEVGSRVDRVLAGVGRR